MNLKQVTIRLISKSDNEDLACLIRSILDEFKVPKVGTTYADKELDQMFETFAVPNAAYYVVEEQNKLLGGAGIIRLKSSSKDICELQKMYLHPEGRGRGIGKKLLQLCLNAASEFGYKMCYLETMSDMKAAQELYLEAGFEFLKERMGATGHYVCPVWMKKDLV